MRFPSHPDRLDAALRPSQEAKQRIRACVFDRIESPAHLLEAKEAVSPSRFTQATLWDRIEGRIASPAAEAALAGVRTWLQPAADVQTVLYQRLQARFTTVKRSPFGFNRMKWVASFAMAAFLITLSPGLFLTSTTVAEARVTLLPTRGEVSIEIGGLWHPVEEEIFLEPGMHIRTDDGEASILFRDDAVLRLDHDTILTLHDTSERRDGESAVESTLTLSSGRLWVQGLLPVGARGVIVETGYGQVTVREGSVSVTRTEADAVTVRAWDRRATVAQGEQSFVLISGEQVQLGAENAVVEAFGAVVYDEPWPNQNLARDAVHRRHIAQVQRERRAASAGILPTSTLYPVKRVAEEVDMLLSFSEEAKVQKRLNRVNARLNEAAALLDSGGDITQVKASLDDYRGELIALAGTGGNSATQLLLKQNVSDTLADVSAALPGDESYLLKQAVFEASAELPHEIVDGENVELVLLLDTLTALNDESDPVSPETLSQAWRDLQPTLDKLEHTETGDPSIQKEAKLLLTQLAETVEENEALRDELPAEDRDTIATYLPLRQVSSVPEWTPMPEAEVERLAARMVKHIDVYTLDRSRQNQLRLEMDGIRGHREEARLLRALFRALPRGSDLEDMVRDRITELRWARAAELYEAEHLSAPEEGSGTVLSE